MDSTAYDRRRSRRLLIAIIAGGLTLLILVGVGIYGLVRGPAEHDTQNPPHPPETSAPVEDGDAETPGLGRIVRTGNPEEFARRVAEALFAWDAASSYGPSDYAQVLIDAGDTSELDALASDVRSYLPTSEAWAQLKTYQARQWLTIDTAEVPTAWETAVEQAAPGQLPAGATAYTITGTRHRTGTWGTVPQDAERAVSLTVFIACPRPAPEFHGTCTLVRLSALDNPLY
ncbi:MAG: hypothetical protein KKF42_01355 [Actinobacteria bacterium]|nr:hypothetical protein [Actinomycetota bacterium]